MNVFGNRVWKNCLILYKRVSLDLFPEVFHHNVDAFVYILTIAFDMSHNGVPEVSFAPIGGAHKHGVTVFPLKRDYCISLISADFKNVPLNQDIEIGTARA